MAAAPEPPDPFHLALAEKGAITPAGAGGDDRLMPHVLCASCGLTTYSAALRAAFDTCPRCGDRLSSGGDEA